MLKRSPFRQPARPERQPTAWPSPIKGGTVARCDAAAEAISKPAQKKGTRADEQRHKARLVLLGCLVCHRIYGQHDPGPVELHHYRGGGWGKGGYMTLMPLCAEHHRGAAGVHGLGTKGFAAHYGFSQTDLLNDAMALIGAGN